MKREKKSVRMSFGKKLKHLYWWPQLLFLIVFNGIENVQ